MVIPINDRQIVIGRYLLECGQTFYIGSRSSRPRLRKLYFLQCFSLSSKKLYCLPVLRDGSYGENCVLSFYDFEFGGFV